MTKSVTLVAIAVALAFGSFLIAAAKLSADPPYLAIGIPENPNYVSLAALIATPNKFDGQVVRVRGFVKMEFEGNMVCLHKEDADQWQSKNCLWLDTESLGTSGPRGVVETVRENYAEVIGVFHQDISGHMDCCSGGLTDISHLMARRDRG